MIDRIIAFSIHNRRVVVLAAVLLTIWGLYAVYQTPIDAVPDLSENQVIVFNEWMGHSPREIEDQITYPLSVDLQGIRGVRVIRSSSDFHFSMIHVIFDDSVSFSLARTRVIEKLSRSRELLPTGVVSHTPPDAIATGQIFWYTVEGGGLDPGRLRSIQDWYVRPQLAAVPGVAEVASVGGHPVEYQVHVDPEQLVRHRLSLVDVVNAVRDSNSTVGGPVILKGNAEYIVRSLGWLGTRMQDGQDEFDQTRAIRDLELAVISTRPDGSILQIRDVGTVSLGPGPRRGVLEKDGSEVAGGVVLMRYGENPLAVTQNIKSKLREIAAGLPQGVKVIPFYDRTPLIRGAIDTVTRTIAEATFTATFCVLLVLLHVRASLIIALTLPLAALGAFALIWLLRVSGLADVQSNIMSLAGIAISIGVLVDSSVVMVESAMHALHERFGDNRVEGDVRSIVLPACQKVGRPIFFSILIMLLSFLPVFVLGGMEGKMFQPLAVTKSFALATVAIVAITLVPALCTIFLRGRIRSEEASWVVRSVIQVYRPVLSSLLDRPSPLVWVLAVTVLVGLAPIGNSFLFRVTLFVGVASIGLAQQSWRGRILGWTGFLLIAIVAKQTITPLGREFMTALDEGMIMDMPISVPRTSVMEATDDLKARDMVLCRFPEVEMVVGKAGRAESPTDPAPMDMIETMVNFRPRELWPKRKILIGDALKQTEKVLDVLIQEQMIEIPTDRQNLVASTTNSSLSVCDLMLREYAYQRNREFERELGGAFIDPDDPGYGQWMIHWHTHVKQLNDELVVRAAETYTRIVLEDLLRQSSVINPKIRSVLNEVQQLRERYPVMKHSSSYQHHGSSELPLSIEPLPSLDSVQTRLSRSFAGGLLLWRKDRAELSGFGAELDQAVQMPGWTNVWTMPIQNRVDMLATGVNTMVGVRVLGRRLEDVVQVSEAVAAALKDVPGAADVIADPIRGKGYIEIQIDRERAALAGIKMAVLNDSIETALGGKVATMSVEGRERHPVRVRLARDYRGDEDAVRQIRVPSSIIESDGRPRLIPLGEVAEVGVAEGPATIKSEGGLLRNYVRLTVRGLDAADFVASARARIAEQIKLPEGVFLEWTGEFEHEARATKQLLLIVPMTLFLIFLILYWTYHDIADAALMMLAIPGAIAGAVFFQWLLGYKFSVTVWIGYIACFGMATSTGIIMLVYLRDAVARAGGLDGMTIPQLREVVLRGAVHRLRPKLLTEGTMILGLAPMLWATGIGSEVLKPMAAPVLGGVLIADEVIDLLIPVVFYHIRRRRLLKRELCPTLQISDT